MYGWNNLLCTSPELSYNGYFFKANCFSPRAQSNLKILLRAGFNEYVLFWQVIISRYRSLKPHFIGDGTLSMHWIAECNCALQWDLPPGMVSPERSLEGSGKYASAVKEIAKRRGLPALDLWTKLQATRDWQTLLSDGLHFTPEGNKVVYKHIINLIGKELPQFRQGRSF